MSIPLQNLPEWGGALGKIASAIRAVVQAHEDTDTEDGRLNVRDGPSGEKLFSLVGDFGSGGYTPIYIPGGGPFRVCTGATVALSASGTRLTLTLNLKMQDLTLGTDGTLSLGAEVIDPVSAYIDGADCSGN